MSAYSEVVKNSKKFKKKNQIFAFFQRRSPYFVSALVLTSDFTNNFCFFKILKIDDVRGPQSSKLFTPLIKDLVFFWPFLAFFVDFRDFEPFVAILGGTSLK